MMTALIRLSPRRAALAGVLTALALLVFGVTGIVYCIAGDARGLTREMQRFAPADVSGLPEEAYPELGRHMADYLTGKKETFQYHLESADGSLLSLFHDHELAHMADCRQLLALDHTVCLVSLLLAAAGLLTAATLEPGTRLAFARGGTRGLQAAAALAAALMLWALANFDGFFVTFHRIAFRNDLWLLDPRTDLLIRLMPSALFMDLGLRGALVAVGWTAAVALGFRSMKKRAAQAVSKRAVLSRKASETAPEEADKSTP